MTHLATQTDVETLFQRTFTAGAQQDAIVQLLRSAEEAVVNFLKMEIDEAVIVAEKHHILHRTHRLMLKRRPVSVVTQIREDSVVLVEDQDYVVVSLEAGLIHRILALTEQTSWQRGYNTVQVDYTAGYASIPEDITTVVAEAAYGSWLADKTLGTGAPVSGEIVSKRLDEYTVRYAESSAASEAGALAVQGVFKIGMLSPAHQAMLSPYKNRRMP